MKNNNKQSFKEFEVFTGEEEKRFLNQIALSDLFFLIATLILMILAENIFHMNIVSWKQYWILFFANAIFFSYFILALKKNFKVWLLKYLLAISIPVLFGGWIYFSDPAYVKLLFGAPTMVLAMIGFIFYNSQLLLITSLVTAVTYWFLIFNFSRVGSPLKPYETYLIYMFLMMGTILYITLIERTKIYLKELLKIRSELQGAKTVLEIKVKARTEELEELNKTLDQKVGQRTKELEQSKKILEKRVDELERFHKLTVGRELKMLELKKEIQKLKDQLSKKG
jgi:hypothetical protein